MQKLSYEQVTTAAVETLKKVTVEAAGKGSDENQSFFDMGRGVVRMWREVVGDFAKQSDQETLQDLLEAMPGYDDEGEGNWRESPVVTL
jgi:hypothetical protein